MKIFQRFAIAMLAVVGVVTFSTRSEAAFQLRITATNGMSSVIFSANDGNTALPAFPGTAILDTDTDADEITAVANFGSAILGLGLNLSVQVQAVLVNTATAPNLNIQTRLTLTNTTGNPAPANIGTITVELSRDGLNAPATPATLLRNSTGDNGGATGVFTFLGTVSSNNTIFGGPPTISTPVITTEGTLATNTGILPTPYSLTTKQVFTPNFLVNGGDEIQGQTNTNLRPGNLSLVVPAPSALLLGMFGLPILAMARRARGRKES